MARRKLMDLGPPDSPAKADEKPMPVKAFCAPTGGAWIEVFVYRDTEMHVTWHRSVDTGTEWVRNRRLPASDIPVLCALLDLAYRYAVETYNAE